MDDNFFPVALNIQNIDRYIVRKSIVEAIDRALPEFSGQLLDIGCGKMPYREYILQNSGVTSYLGLDIESALVYDSEVKPDATWDGITMPFGDNSFDCAFGTEVLEHCPNPNGVLKEVIRVIKPGSVFFFTVPFLWNLHEVPHDEYRYTPFSLERHLKEAGFTSITIKATGGWHASMAQMLGLWVRRAPISSYKRKILMQLIIPLMRILIKTGKRESFFFKEGQMITGLYGIARKG